jgi:para-nitrobenzyl esterase
MSLVFSFLKPITALCFVVSLFACTAFNTNIDGVVVTTSHGQVRGADAGNVISFKGIRYAAPSIGDNRWREPQPLENWDGVVDATQYGSDCMQKPFPSDAAPLGEIPKEDCLFVNIW